MNTRFVKGVIYRLKHAYPNAKRGYCCCVPADTGDYTICDCWITNEQGQVDPGLNVSPVPLGRGWLGAVIGRSDLA